jgi:hypothetical protein
MSSLIKSSIIGHELCVCEYDLRVLKCYLVISKIDVYHASSTRSNHKPVCGSPSSPQWLLAGQMVIREPGCCLIYGTNSNHQLVRRYHVQHQ